MGKEQTIKEWFAAELRERMEDAELRPYHMAYLCRVKPNSINNYLQGSTLPNLWSLVLMAENLDCTVNDLLGFDEVDDISRLEPYLASAMFPDENRFAACLSDRIVRYMNRNNLTIDDLGSRTQFNTRTIKRWIGLHPQLPRTSAFLQICDALDCTPSELLGY